MHVETLVKKAQKGNWQAFLELALAKKDILYHKALTLMGNEHDAADAVEETMVKAYNAVASLKEPQYFQTWLTRILIHTCMDMKKKAAKTIYLRPELLEGALSHPAEDLADKLDLKEQLAKLGEEYRDVLVLRYYGDLKVEEIALHLGIPTGTVKSRIYYGLKKLRKGMGGLKHNEM